MMDTTPAGTLTRVAAAEAVDTDGDRRYHDDYENQMTKAEQREDGAATDCCRQRRTRRATNGHDQSLS